MRKEEVEIYSDASNFAIMRHPGRRFPGSLIQGDSLSILSGNAELACRLLREGNTAAALEAMEEVRESLQTRLTHYKEVLVKHEMPLPFREIPPT
ncbi:MAG TPA: hypothetical protein EYH07_08775 [Kiloniellaceae bacterium]|nr:hypothetical protein [Kiloniellaceae bacterium]HIP78537.1 hypothetical protein [Kiloniellaceae bacterium]